MSPIQVPAPTRRGSRVHLAFPRRADERELVALNRRSREFHHPWITPPQTPAQFRRYLARSRTPAFVGLLIRRNIDDAVVGSVELSIAGSGDITIGNIAGGISIEIAGSGEVKAQSVNGPVKIEVAGAGDITIDSGKATSFDVEIMGAGDIKFGGEANNPKVEMFGSGDVWIRSYTGSLSSEGGGEVRVGGDG